MQLGYIGLGKMGSNMVLHLLEKKHAVVAWNRSPDPREVVAAAGADIPDTVAELISRLSTPRIVWVMLPSGEVTHQMVLELSTLLSPGDTLIDGGNTFYKDTQKHAEILHEKNIHFIDVGVSGGPAGARSGACLMIGGNEEAFEAHKQLFIDVASENALQFFPGSGAGHFVKMVHNGIEYGMMQAIAEGFSILKASPFALDLKKATSIYNHRSVIESRLIGWLYSGYEKHGTELEDISGSISNNGEGKWTAEAAKEMGLPAPIIQASYDFRMTSQSNPSYTGKVVSVLRNEFGGHDVKIQQ